MFKPLEFTENRPGVEILDSRFCGFSISEIPFAEFPGSLAFFREAVLHGSGNVGRDEVADIATVPRHLLDEV
jgi:hypothetical protein